MDGVQSAENLIGVKSGPCMSVPDTWGALLCSPLNQFRTEIKE